MVYSSYKTIRQAWREDASYSEPELSSHSTFFATIVSSGLLHSSWVKKRIGLFKDRNCTQSNQVRKHSSSSNDRDFDLAVLVSSVREQRGAVRGRTRTHWQSRREASHSSNTSQLNNAHRSQKSDCHVTAIPQTPNSTFPLLALLTLLGYGQRRSDRAFVSSVSDDGCGALDLLHLTRPCLGPAVLAVAELVPCPVVGTASTDRSRCVRAEQSEKRGCRLQSPRHAIQPPMLKTAPALLLIPRRGQSLLARVL
eukprot:1943146-Rhodomonas_salina.2